VVVTNVAGSVTSSAAVLTVDVPPSITRQPAGVTTSQGGSATFSVAAAGTAPLGYKWLFNGAAIPGATNATLTLTDVQAASDGNYSVVVANVAGSATSSKALLTVNVPPAITQQPRSQTVTNGVNVTFTVTAAGTAPLAYQWEFNGAVLPKGTNASLTLADVQTTNGGNYTVEVTNVAGAVTSSPAKLTVVIPVGPLLVAVTSPANDARFAVGEGIEISASASETNGSISSLAFYNNTTNLLGSTNGAYFAALWTNALSGTHLLTAVATDSLGLSATSVVVSIAVTNQPPPPPTLTVSISSPANNATVCNGNNLLVQALVTNSQPIASVQFYAGGSVLGSEPGQAGQTAYSFEWTQTSPVPLSIGSYMLTVVATDTQGHSATSAPVAVSVTAQCAQVAIVRAGAGPEIDALQSYLTQITQMGLTSQVFDQAGLNASLLQGFQLIIWDDGGQATNAPAPNTVDALAQSYSNGIPLYLIGRHLASSAALLPPAQQSEWTNLTFLSESAGTVGNGSVQITNLNSLANPILSASFGLVTNFDYAAGLDLATNTQPLAEVFGVSGGADVLMAYPGPDFVTTGFTGTNLFVQNALVLPPGSPESVGDLQILFGNAVCWLIGGCTVCPAQEFTLNYPNASLTAQAGQPFTVALFVENSAPCPSVGVVVTNALPPGVGFVSASSDRGTFSYSPGLNQVVFYLGLLPRSVPVNFYVTMMSPQPGLLTNTVSGMQNTGPSPPPAQATINVLGNPAPVLVLQMLAPNTLQLSLGGQAGVNYEVDSSSDLLSWLVYTNVTGPGWNQILPPLTGVSGKEFYRAKVTP
jgi:uncharacterized repeat protein (TIGR01451 family)